MNRNKDVMFAIDKFKKRGYNNVMISELSGLSGTTVRSYLLELGYRKNDSSVLRIFKPFNKKELVKMCKVFDSLRVEEFDKKIHRTMVASIKRLYDDRKDKAMTRAFNAMKQSTVK